MKLTATVLSMCAMGGFALAYAPSIRAQENNNTATNVGCNNVTLSVDNLTNGNPGQNGCGIYEQTGQPVAVGTNLSLALMVRGVASTSTPPNCQPGSCSNSPNFADVVCHAEGDYGAGDIWILSERIYSDKTPQVFNWTPTQADRYHMFCTVHYQGNGQTGPSGYVTTVTILLPVQ